MATKTTTAKPAKGNVNMTQKIRAGYVSHTELSSTNPSATKAWCEKVLGWEFGDAMPTPTGPYHMWRFDEGSGGGIRSTNPDETPGATPYVEVNDIKATHAKALKAGAKEMVSPMEVPGSGGWISAVQIPGGPSIGFWGTK